MGRAASMASGPGDLRKKLDQAQRHLEQIKGEEEARNRRIALRKGRQEFQRKKPESQSTWWLKPLLSAAALVGGLALVAWYWPLVQKFLQ